MQRRGWQVLAGLSLAACSEPPATPAVDRVWQQAFSRLDKDSDGRLGGSELGAFGPSDVHVKALDSNSDGHVDFDEWTAMIVGMPPRHQRDLRATQGASPTPSSVAPLTSKEIAERLTLFRRDGKVATRDGPPNILIVDLDTVRADHLSSYGHEQHTSPHLTALAARGVLFENSIANANESLYSHASIWTSRYASEVARPVYQTYVVPDTAQTMAEVMKAYGYATGGFAAGGHLDGDFGHSQGFDTYTAEKGFGSFWNTVPAFLSWLDKRDDAQPWFAFVHSYDAHAPYRTLPPFAHAFSEGKPVQKTDRLLRDPMFPERVKDRHYYPGRPSFFHHPKGFSILSTETYTTLEETSDIRPIPLHDTDIAHLKDHYDGCIAYADMQLGVLLAALDDRGWSANTLIIVMSDHGEDLLDHSYVNHRTGLYDSIVRVPTVVAGPGFPTGKRVSEMVQALDFLPTVVRAAEGVLPAGARGRPLQDVASGDQPATELVFIEGVMDQLSVRTATHKLIASGFPLAAPDLPKRLSVAGLVGTHFQLFDLAADPDEQQNLLVDPDDATRALADRLRAGLIRWRTDLGVGTAVQRRSAVDPAVAEQMRRHGYWEAEPKPAE